MAEFKIGEVNNYFSQDDANSIFKANIDDNVTEDQRDKKKILNHSRGSWEKNNGKTKSKRTDFRSVTITRY